jgi:hypothetical protein
MSSAATVATLGIDVENTEAISALNEFRRSARSVSGDIRGISGAAGNATSEFSRLAASVKQVSGAIAAFYAGSRVAGMLRDWTETASYFREENAKFNDVFEANRGAARAFSQELIRGYDLSQVSAQQLITTNAQIMQSMGIAGDKALELASKVGRASIDMAAFRNDDIADFADRITSALAGSFVPLKKYGILMGEDSVKAQILKDSQNGLRASSEEAARAQAIITLALGKTANVEGYAASEAGSYASQLRKLNDQVLAVRAALGEGLIDGVTSMLQVGNRLVSMLRGLGDENLKMIGRFAAVAVTIGTVVVGWRAIQAAIKTYRALQDTATATQQIANTQSGETVTAQTNESRARATNTTAINAQTDALTRNAVARARANAGTTVGVGGGTIAPAINTAVVNTRAGAAIGRGVASTTGTVSAETIASVNRGASDMSRAITGCNTSLNNFGNSISASAAGVSTSMRNFAVGAVTFNGTRVASALRSTGDVVRGFGRTLSTGATLAVSTLRVGGAAVNRSAMVFSQSLNSTTGALGRFRTSLTVGAANLGRTLRNLATSVGQMALTGLVAIGAAEAAAIAFTNIQSQYNAIRTFYNELRDTGNVFNATRASILAFGDTWVNNSRFLSGWLGRVTGIYDYAYDYEGGNAAREQARQADERMRELRERREQQEVDRSEIKRVDEEANEAYRVKNLKKDEIIPYYEEQRDENEIARKAAYEANDLKTFEEKNKKYWEAVNKIDDTRKAMEEKRLEGQKKLKEFTTNVDETLFNSMKDQLKGAKKRDYIQQGIDYQLEQAKKIMREGGNPEEASKLIESARSLTGELPEMQNLSGQPKDYSHDAVTADSSEARRMENRVFEQSNKSIEKYSKMQADYAKKSMELLQKLVNNTTYDHSGASGDLVGIPVEL